MNKFVAFCTLVVWSATAGCKRKQHPEVSSRVSYDETSFRVALNEVEPDLRTISHLFDGHVILGLYRRRNTNEYLLVLQPSVIGDLVVSVNGKPIDNAFERPLRTMSAGLIRLSDGTSEDDHTISSEFDLGHWLTLSEADELVIEGEISYPAERKLFLRFSAPNNIETTILPLIE